MLITFTLNNPCALCCQANRDHSCAISRRREISLRRLRITARARRTAPRVSGRNYDADRQALGVGRPLVPPENHIRA